MSRSDRAICLVAIAITVVPHGIAIAIHARRYLRVRRYPYLHPSHGLQWPSTSQEHHEHHQRP